eukprot:CAMPEP_0170410990 /NCGR_PEP_ID=MMETSP0117_2-20130122/30186_1 /TAXON_ID=400756 /ORGANISM="Durinskia baltica, Strain CSIRO CS-38" /LENGTH=60 /DNA_ID=CAMNT_0010668563 /DNA_START=60 /DNA_END=239 /DNA_ORIENTATION=+
MSADSPSARPAAVTLAAGDRGFEVRTRDRCHVASLTCDPVSTSAKIGPRSDRRAQPATPR